MPRLCRKQLSHFLRSSSPATPARETTASMAVAGAGAAPIGKPDFIEASPNVAPVIENDRGDCRWGRWTSLVLGAQRIGLLTHDAQASGVSNGEREHGQSRCKGFTCGFYEEEQCGMAWLKRAASGEWLGWMGRGDASRIASRSIRPNLRASGRRTLPCPN
ncbi:hypothetical protein VTJ04DRAFT_6455 [Mycothermus thermophilus]|uniref:uncharacterized protein n=1 Tax=Humicola insolens TaxID=85995 RepID=UPI0037438BD9